MDFFYQWWDYERQMKMTKQEVKEEYKQMEGDPQVKGNAQEDDGQQDNNLDQVFQGFHKAFQGEQPQDDAPIVLAKGQDNIALRIVQIAEENKVAHDHHKQRYNIV